MYDDFPEPPPAPPACPNCNEELTDDPATPPGHYWGHAHVGAYCIGADGCGWHGTWAEAEEYALEVGCAKAEAQADAGPDWHSEFRPGLIPVPGTVPDAEQDVARYLTASGYESVEAWGADSGYVYDDCRRTGGMPGWYDEDGQGPYELHDQIQAVIEAQTWEVTILQRPAHHLTHPLPVT